MHRGHNFRPSVEELEGRTLPSQGALAVGALGDSYTDEYRFYPPDRSRARNWIEILAATRPVDFGPFTTRSRGGPRNQGFALNWALEGATSTDMVQDQLPGLAAQVAQGKVAYAWIFIGGDDLLYFLRDTAAGRLPSDQAVATVGQVESRMETNFTTAVHTLLAASPHVRLVVATLPDVSLLALVRLGEAVHLIPPSLVNATSQAIQRYNALIRNTGSGDGRIAVADLAAAAGQLAAEVQHGPVRFGGITLDLARPGDGFRHFFLADGIHVGTVGQGIIADAFINAIDARFGAHLAPLTPRQIVDFAGHIGPRTP